MKPLVWSLNLIAEAVPPGDPSIAISTVGQPVLAGELVAGAAGITALCGYHRNEGELAEVQLQILYIRWLQLTSRTPGAITLLPVQSEREEGRENENLTERDREKWGKRDIQRKCYVFKKFLQLGITDTIKGKQENWPEEREEERSYKERRNANIKTEITHTDQNNILHSCIIHTQRKRETERERQ